MSKTTERELRSLAVNGRLAMSSDDAGFQRDFTRAEPH